jgi:hypothetical protein
MTNTQEQAWVDKEAFDKAFFDCIDDVNAYGWVKNFVKEYEKHRNPWRTDFENMPKDGTPFVGIVSYKSNPSLIDTFKYNLDGLYFVRCYTYAPFFDAGDFKAWMPIPEWKGK